MNIDAVMWASYVMLVALVVGHSAVLMQVLKEVLWWKQMLEPSPGTQQLPTGSPMPTLRATSLDAADGTSSVAAITGATILFVSPEDNERPEYQDLLIGVSALWHKTHGALYLLCTGSRAQCQEFTTPYADAMIASGHRLHVLVDESGWDAASCLISTTPQAIVVDGHGNVVSYGAPVPRVSRVLEMRAVEA